MNFMSDDDFLLLMSLNLYHSSSFGNYPYHIHNEGEKARLYGAGIRTSHEQPPWLLIEPSKGQYDFDYLDSVIRTNRNAGLKSLIQISGWINPAWMPDEWFAKDMNGNKEVTCISFWNEEAQQHSDNHYQTMVDHYKDEKDVAFFFGEFQGGEGAYNCTWCFRDDAAVQDYKKVYGTDAMPTIDSQETLDWFGKKVVEHFVRKMEILYPPYHEMWNAQQYLMNTWHKSYGNFVQPEIMKKFHELHPDGTVVLLQYTYFDSSHGDANASYVDTLRGISGCEVIAEAMFCNGLAHTTPKAIAKGFRGQIIHPQHSGFGTEPLDDGMINAIRTSNDLWKANYENRSSN